MKRLRKPIAWILSVMMILTTLPITALADEVTLSDSSSSTLTVTSTPELEVTPTPEPEVTPTPEPEVTPTPEPEATPTPEPEATPTPEPEATPSPEPEATPTPEPEATPSPKPEQVPGYQVAETDRNGDFLWPVPGYGTVSQGYDATKHTGIDISAEQGVAVIAAADGTVSYVQIWDGSYDTTGMMSYGHMVEVRHADGNTTLYAHLSEINVQQGEKVVRGQRIGRVGSTGNATGPHLHFEVITSEGKADPAEYLWTMPGEWIMGYAADTEAGISPTGIGDTGKSVIHYYSLAKDTTTTVTGSLGHLPTKAIKSGSTEYPAYCLEKAKLIWGNIDFTWSSFTVPQQTTMKAILAEGFHETNSLDKAKWGDAQGSGLKGNYANETAKWLVTQYLIWAAEKNYITKHSNTSWTWKSQVDTDLETVAKNAYNPTVVRSYYAEVKAKLLNAYTIPSFASSSSSSFSTTIKMYWDGSKYTATVTDSKSVAAYYTYTYNGITFTKNGNKLTISTTKEYPSGVVATGSRTIGDDSNLAWWKCTDSAIQLIATPLGKTKTVRSYLKVQTVTPSYYIYLKKSSSNTSITNGDSGYSLAGAVYKIYNSSGTEVASITTDSSGKGSSSAKLKNGTYTAVESKAPPGYALDTTRHTVRINNADATLNVSDVPLIKTVTLTKTSANTSITAGNSNYSLAGAVYDVYEGNSATGTPVASFTTNTSGVATLSRKLYPNRTYTVLERTPPPGYVKDTTPHLFYLTYNAATMDVVDDPQYVKIMVKKKDSGTKTNVAAGNASLAGAVYAITYKENGVDKTVQKTTNSSGILYFTNVPLGEIKIQEISAPVGYKLDSTVHTYNVTSDKVTSAVYEMEPEDFTEDVFKGHIQITKQIEMLGADAQLEQGAEYQVYLKSAGSYNAAKDTERDYLVTGADGKATTKDLPYGTYTLHQVKDVPGREFKDMDVDVHENGKTYEMTLTNELKYAPLKIVKTSEDGNVAGFTFKVTRLADGYSKTYTTSAAGEIITDQMPVYVDKDANQKFEYRIEEINVPDKYRTPDAQTITLTYRQTAEVRFYNQIARGTLEILKVDHDGVTPLEGAKFEITDDNGNVIATKTSGPDGKIKVDSILYGQYHWSEVMAPKGYELDDTVHDFAIEYDEQIVEVTQENTPSVGSITAKKVDADGNAMPGVEFTLEYSTDDGATWAPVEARAEDSKPSIGGCTSAVVDGALITDENGVTTFNGLQVDNQTVTITYRLTETGTKSGNTLLAAPFFIGSLPQVLDDGTETVDVVVTAVNNQNYTLPSSGGNGMTSVPIGIALALISASCFAAWLWKKKLF